MSKNKPFKEEASPIESSYSVSRFNSGYVITKYSIQNKVVISSERVSEPDMLAITMASLDKMLRKDNGL